MIALSNPQLDEVKRIIRKFENKADVRVERESPPTLMATFVVADQQFYWLGPYLVLESPRKTGKWYVVKDPVLAKLGKAYYDAESTVRPSREAYVEMLKILEEGAARPDVTPESTHPKVEETPQSGTQAR